MRFFTLLIVLAVGLVTTSARAQSSGSFDLSEAPSVGAPIAFVPPGSTRMRSELGFYAGVGLATAGMVPLVGGFAALSSNNAPRCNARGLGAIGCGLSDARFENESFGYLAMAVVGTSMVLGGGITMLTCAARVPLQPDERAANAVTLRPRVEVGVGSARATWRF